MLEAYSQALATLLQPINMLVLLTGAAIGLIVGIIPVIGGLFALSLLLPFIFGLPAEIGLIFLVAIHSIGNTSGGITSILINIPGQGPCAATMLDGFPMNQRGEGARAIGACVSSSMFGGLIPVIFALAMIPAILPIALALGQPEMAALIILGISFVATLSGDSIMKGLIAGLAGLLLSLVGYHAITGIHRYTFDTAFLYDGIALIPLILGLFGVCELFLMLSSRQNTIAQQPVITKTSAVLSGLKDVWRHGWLWFRCTVIGYIVGIIPGIGTGVAAWLCYGHAKQTSKHPEEFGTGRVEGVIAPEAANNAAESGALLTTMALGIPGSAGMSIMLAALLVLGITPGPQMVTENLPLSITLLLTVAFANIIGGVICLFTANYMVRLALVPLDFLFSGILVVIMTGVYIATLSMWNFVIIICFGLLGLVMKNYGYSRPAFTLGFILGQMFENYLLLSLKLHGPLFFITPISLTLLVITIVMLNYRSLARLTLLLRSRLVRS